MLEDDASLFIEKVSNSSERGFDIEKSNVVDDSPAVRLITKDSVVFASHARHQIIMSSERNLLSVPSSPASSSSYFIIFKIGPAFRWFV